MATPVFCCGFECGVAGVHATLGVGTAFDTGTVRSGARSIRANPAASTVAYVTLPALAANNKWIWRIYVRFATLPNVDTMITSVNAGASDGVHFKVSDSKLYTGYYSAFGATGFAVTTGVWYRIDAYVNMSANPWTIDASINGTPLAQLTRAAVANTAQNIYFGFFKAAPVTADVYFDDLLVSNTIADYPLGAGYVNHFVPTADGTHNVAGTNDFEIGTGGVDINNATTTAWQLLDDIPMQSGVIGTTDFINLIAPAAATNYVEVVYGPAPGISTPTVAPRAVEALVGYAENSAGVNNIRLALNDNGTTDDIFNGDPAGGTTISYSRKNYIDPPSAASAWTLSGNGNFNNLRIRCYSSDPAPDTYFASTMLEAEFAEIVSIPNKIVQVKQAVNRSATY